MTLALLDDALGSGLPVGGAFQENRGPQMPVILEAARRMAGTGAHVAAVRQAQVTTPSGRWVGAVVRARDADMLTELLGQCAAVARTKAAADRMVRLPNLDFTPEGRLRFYSAEMLVQTVAPRWWPPAHWALEWRYARGWEAQPGESLREVVLANGGQPRPLSVVARPV